MTSRNRVLGESFRRAIDLAMIAHEDDVRKGTTIPYLSHLLQVSGLVLEFGGGEPEAIAGLLHDAAEDAGGEAMLDRIEREFGPEVAGIVRENSDSVTDSKAAKAPWVERKEAYIAAIGHKSEAACLVSIADKVHNARALLSDTRELGEAHWSRFNCTKDQSLWYYRRLAEEFQAVSVSRPRLVAAASELATAVRQLEAAAA